MKKELSPNEIKKVELDILKYLHNICAQEGLKYYLSYGSLLGAVRHKGFIPWDDDIDVQMPREDMEKLMKYFETHNTGHYILKNIYNDEKYICTFPKLMDSRIELTEDNAITSGWGPFVDIFPLDNVGNSIKKARRKCKKLIPLSYFIHLSSVNKVIKSKNFLTKIIKNTIYYISKLWDTKKLIKRFDRISKKQNNKNSEYVAVLTAGNEKGIMPTTLYHETIEVEFEGEKFIAVKDYDYFLRKMYGENYMELPPEDKRICHNLKAQWKDID